MYRHSIAIVAVLSCLLVSCAVTPRTSSWEGPKRFTKDEVYKAALQSGTENGWQGTASDRESGTMSFSKTFDKDQMVLNVSISDKDGRILVHTVANYTGGLAIKGHHEEFIRNFHVGLFRKLNITDTAERQIIITELS